MGTDQLKGKRGKKGGTRFPRYSLKHLVALLDSFLGKTHTSTISIEQLNAGVFNVSANSPKGKTKFSALKQFGLADGDYKKINSTSLCSDIAMSDGDVRITHLQKALQNVKPFADTLKTFQNSATEKTKIGQYAVSNLKVHPDLRDNFVKMFVESCEEASLCQIDGQSISFEQNPDLNINLDENPITEEENSEDEKIDKPTEKKEEQGSQSYSTKKQGNSNINVNIDVDPSMDPEKLEKLLKLLKGYGAI
jgi:hypothetical protein